VLAITVPPVLGVIEAEQLEVVALIVARVQGVPVKVPVAVPELVNATDPVGALVVPADELSLTKAVHVVVWPTAIELGVQLTIWEVVRKVTVTVLPVPVLPL
jgi:hypothetical protein